MSNIKKFNEYFLNEGFVNYTGSIAKIDAMIKAIDTKAPLVGNKKDYNSKLVDQEIINQKNQIDKLAAPNGDPDFINNKGLLTSLFNAKLQSLKNKDDAKYIEQVRNILDQIEKLSKI